MEENGLRRPCGIARSRLRRRFGGIEGKKAGISTEVFHRLWKDRREKRGFSTRMREEGRKTEESLGKAVTFLWLARLRLYPARRFFYLRADACGFGILQVVSFFVFADGAGRLQAAQGHSRLGNPPFNVRTMDYLHLSSMRCSQTADETSFIVPIQRLITGASPRLSGTLCFMARSTPKRQLVRVRLFDSVEA